MDSITPEPAAPVTPIVMYQEWNHLTSLHWAYDADEVQRLLPERLIVDTFDGSAWVGLIPFELENIAFRRSPSIPYFGSFPEVNVRTYVVDPRGRRSVWFLSLDISRAAPVAAARAGYGLPYCWGSASVDRSATTQYSFRRRWPRRPSAHFEASVVPGAPITEGELTELDHFITARWGMSTMRRGVLLHGSVWHPQWPLHRAELVSIDQTLLDAAGLSVPHGDPYVVFSPGVAVHIGPLETVIE